MPAPDLVTRFQSALARLAPDGPYGVAVSGGPDSLALLLLAQAARPGEVCAATIDHGLRPDSGAEAVAVASHCESLGVPHTVIRVEVKQRGEGLQAAARSARYLALARWGETHQIPSISTAHHIDDQAETLLMRLSRAAGIKGLAGVRPIVPLGGYIQEESALRPQMGFVSIIRPLLGFRKTELGQVLTDAGVEGVDDPSNRDPRFDRTRIRKLLADASWLRPERLAAASQHLLAADDALDWAARREWSGRLHFARERTWAFKPDDLPDELLRRLVVIALTHACETDGRRLIYTGPKLSRLIDRLRTGQASTLCGVTCRPGERWSFSPAPPRRTSS